MPLRLAKREAWRWMETQRHRGELASLEYNAVVSFGDVTCMVEFYCANPLYRDPAPLRSVVSSLVVTPRR